MAGLFGASVWACTVTTASSPYPDVQSFCAAKAKAECQITSVCLNDTAGCQTTRVTVCLQDASQATGSGTRTYSADLASACINLVNQAYGNGNSKIAYSQLVGTGSITDTCARVFAGKVDKNQPCQSDYDCSGTRVCAPVAAGSTQRVCADPEPKNEGDFCADPGSTCATDTYCAVQDAGAPQCVPAVTAGPCSETVPCVSANRCVAGLCEARAGLGQACSTDGDCVPSAPFCDPYIGGKCSTGLTFAAQAPDCNGYQPSAADAGSSGAIADAGAGDSAADVGVGSDAAADAGDAAGE
jgi:hypothetical protein